MSINKENISWSPASSLGSNFCSHRLFESSPWKLEFKPTWAMKLFTLTFNGISGIVFIVFFIGWLIGVVPLGFFIISSLFFLLFFYLGKYLFKLAYAPKYFDFRDNIFYSVNYSLTGAEEEIRKTISEIKALQILPKRVTSSKASYIAYELNLVLESLDRLTLVSHSNYSSIKDDAGFISRRIGVSIIEENSL